MGSDAPRQAAPAASCALVFDHGGKRIGVAIANIGMRMASVLTTIPARNGVPDWAEVDRLIREWRPARLVVGVPYNEPGTSASEAAAERFAAELEARSSLPVIRVDERLTSVEATGRLREQRQSGLRRRKVRAEDIDAQAACVIAETWLNQQEP